MVLGRSPGFIGRGSGGGGCSASRSHGWSGFGGDAPFIAPLTPWHQTKSKRTASRPASGGRPQSGRPQSGRPQSRPSTSSWLDWTRRPADLDLLPTTLHSLPALPYLAHGHAAGKRRPQTHDSMKKSESLPELATPLEEQPTTSAAGATLPRGSYLMRSQSSILRTSFRSSLTEVSPLSTATDALMARLVMGMSSPKFSKNKIGRKVFGRLNRRGSANCEVNGMSRELSGTWVRDRGYWDQPPQNNDDNDGMEEDGRRKSFVELMQNRRSSSVYLRRNTVTSLAPFLQHESPDQEDGQNDNETNDPGKENGAKSLDESQSTKKRSESAILQRARSDIQAENPMKTHWTTVFSRFEDQGEVHRDDLNQVLSLIGYARPVKELVDQASSTVSTYATFNKVELFDFIQLYATLESDHMKSTFMKYDRDKSGSLDVQELKPLLQHYGMTPLTYVVQGILDEVDADNNGTLDFEEFLACTIVLREQHGFTEQEVEDLCFAFHKFDRSHTGSMSTMELAGALNWLGYSLAMKEIMGVGQEVDVDRSGRISLDEFLTCMRKVREREFVRINQIIQDCDIDNSGGIDPTEFTNVLRALGYNPEPVAVSQALEEAGVNNYDHEYGLDEICQFLEVFRLRDGFSRDECEEIERAFSLYDVGGDGILSQEAQNLLVRLGYKIHVDALQKLILKVDVDHSGTLDVSEFRKLIRIYRKQENSKMNRAFDKNRHDKTNRSHSSQDMIVFEQAEAALYMLFEEADVDKFLENIEQDERQHDSKLTRQEFETMVQKMRDLDREAIKASAGFNEHQIRELNDKFCQYDPEGLGSIGPETLQKVTDDLAASFELTTTDAHTDFVRAAEVDKSGRLDFKGFVRFVRLAKDLLDRDLQRHKEQDLVHSTNFTESELVGLRNVFMHQELNRHHELSFTEFQLMLADLVPLKLQHIPALKDIFETITHKSSADFAEFASIWDMLLKENFLGLANLGGSSADAN